MSGIRVEQLTKRFGSLTAVDDLTMGFAAGTVTCLLGPSGCGKTTLLRMIAGLESPTGGRMSIAGQRVDHLPPRKRDVAMVFQYPVMYPTLSVEENIALPLVHGGLDRAERAKRLDEVLALLELEEARRATIHDLDNGTRQKVVVGRCVIRRTGVLLFDEPTTNVELDAKLRMLRAFKAVTRALDQTIVYVTHDQTEAMTVADRIALMRDGRIVQFDTPRETYRNPNNVFGGWFLGNPGINLLDARAASDGGIAVPALGMQYTFAAATGAAERAAGDRLRIGVRPEHLRVAPPAHGAAHGAAAEVVHKAVSLGGQMTLTLALDGQRVKAKLAASAARGIEDKALVSLEPRHLLLFANEDRIPGRLEADTSPAGMHHAREESP